jgi:Putative restriction endonuclease
VVEVVSNKEGGELDHKLKMYARQGISYYIVYDPDELLKQGPLAIFYLHARSYRREESKWLGDIGLGLTIWRGTYEGLDGDWLRWCDESGKLFLTGTEGKQQERVRADQEKVRADQERVRADQEKQRADRLAAQLRQLGVDPEQ